MMVRSGLKVVVVPVPTAGPITRTGATGMPQLILLHMQLVVALDLDAAVLGERVDGGDADAVQTAGALLVAVAAELAARVQRGHHDLERGLLGALRVRLDGDAAAVVLDGDGAVRAE